MQPPLPSALKAFVVVLSLRVVVSFLLTNAEEVLYLSYVAFLSFFFFLDLKHRICVLVNGDQAGIYTWVFGRRQTSSGALCTH